jgi:hypothetical protein
MIASLLALLATLDASTRSLRRDECGDYAIKRPPMLFSQNAEKLACQTTQRRMRC